MTFTVPTDDSLETTAQIRTDKLGPQPCPRRRRQSRRELELAGGRGRVKIFRQGPELHSRPVQALDRLQPVGQPLESRSMWVTTRVSPSTTRSSSSRRPPPAPLAGMGKSIPSCQGEINRVFQPPPELRQGGIPSGGRKQGCFQPGPPAGEPRWGIRR